jgi:hypothetical protein
VASADELIREAEYAFRNISHGSTSEDKYKARARKYAKQVLRKYPAGVEASQARAILERLNVKIDVRSPDGVSPQHKAAANFEKSHTPDSGHTGSRTRTRVTSAAQFKPAGNQEEWRGLIRRFLALPGGKKKFLGIIAVIAVLFPGGIFAVSGLVIFYALQTALLKRHIGLLLDRLESS